MHHDNKAPDSPRRATYTSDGVRRLDRADLDQLSATVADGYALPRRWMQAAISWARWLCDTRGRMVVETLRLHADGQVTDFALQIGRAHV